MKTSECRIGNYVALKKKPNFITTIQPSSLEGGLIKERYEGIPITKDWLQKFNLKEGFKWTPTYTTEVSKNKYKDFKIVEGDGRYSVYINNNIGPIWIHTVHELQNIYHMFMGKELKAD